MHFPTHSGFFRGGCCVLGNFAARSFRKRISRVESCFICRCSSSLSHLLLRCSVRFNSTMRFPLPRFFCKVSVLLRLEILCANLERLGH